VNVLLTCAGRRTSLLKAFQEAVRPWNSRVFAGDRDPLAPALYWADQAVHLPEVIGPDYVPRLLDLVQKHNLGLIVPTIDTELPILAEAAPALEAHQCRVLISTPAFVELAADKWATVQTYAAHGFRTPPSWIPTDGAEAALPERLFVKPRTGSAARDTYRVHRDHLAHVLALVQAPIIQQEIQAPEITIDALLNFDGELIHYVPRRRIRTQAGESIQSVTLADETLRPWLVEVLALAATLGARGPLTLQAFLTEDGPMLLEINPRFGGGYPLTLAAGGHYPAWILRMLHGQTIAPCLGAYTTGLYMTRYYVEHFTEQPLWSM